jgi:hypothetical protein
MMAKRPDRYKLTRSGGPGNCRPGLGSARSAGAGPAASRLPFGRRGTGRAGQVRALRCAFGRTPGMLAAMRP